MRVIFILSFLISKFCFAQISAVTSSGEEVILYKNGTWKYVSKDSVTKEIETNKKTFTKNSNSTFQVKSNIISNLVVYIDPKAWSFQKPENGPSEYKFRLKDKDAYGMLITERIEIELESLKEVALKNARNAAPDIKLVKQEYRMVNGTKVLFMQMDGTIQGIQFSYYGYYYSSKSGSVQFLTYTSQSLLEEYKPSFENLLNGLVITQ